jgi:hypothetical protein
MPKMRDESGLGSDPASSFHQDASSPPLPPPFGSSAQACARRGGVRIGWGQIELAPVAGRTAVTFRHLRLATYPRSSRHPLECDRYLILFLGRSGDECSASNRGNAMRIKFSGPGSGLGPRGSGGRSNRQSRPCSRLVSRICAGRRRARHGPRSRDRSRCISPMSAVG